MNQFGKGHRQGTNGCNQTFRLREKEENEGGGPPLPLLYDSNRFNVLSKPQARHENKAALTDWSPLSSSIQHSSLGLALSTNNDARRANNNNNNGGLSSSPFRQPRSSMVPAPVMSAIDYYPSSFNNDNLVGCFRAAPLVAWTTTTPIVLPSMPLFQHGTGSQHHHDVATNPSVPTTTMLRKRSTGNTPTTRASRSYGGSTAVHNTTGLTTTTALSFLLLTVAIFMFCMYCHSIFTLLLLSLLLSVALLLLCAVPQQPAPQHEQQPDRSTGHTPVPIIWQPILPLYDGITVPLFAVCKAPHVFVERRVVSDLRSSSSSSSSSSNRYDGSIQASSLSSSSSRTFRKEKAMNACHDHEFFELRPSDGTTKKHNQTVVYSTMETITTTTTTTFGGTKGPLVPLLARNDDAQRCVPEMATLTTFQQGGNSNKSNCTMLSHRQRHPFMSADHNIVHSFQHNPSFINEQGMKKRTAKECDIKRPRIPNRCKPKLLHERCFQQQQQQTTNEQQTRIMMCGNENHFAARRYQEDNPLVVVEQPKEANNQQPPLERESYLHHPPPQLPPPPPPPRTVLVRKEDAGLELDFPMLTERRTTKRRYLDLISTTRADPDTSAPEKKKKKRRKQPQNSRPG